MLRARSTTKQEKARPLRKGGKRSSVRKVFAMDNERSDTERSEPQGSDPPGIDPEAGGAEAERSEPIMEESKQPSVSTILKRPRVLALIAALVILVVVLITACGGGDDTADAGAESTSAEIVDPVEDLPPEPDPPAEVTDPPVEDPPVVEEADLPITKVKGKALKKGMTNNRVMTLQEGLIYLGYLEEGSADGKFGQKTKKAVQEFQLEQGLNGDGVAGQKTIRVINVSVKRAPAGGATQPSEPAAADDASGTDGSGADDASGDSGG